MLGYCKLVSGSTAIAKELLMRLDAFHRKKQQLKGGSLVSDLQILASWQLNDPVQICSDDETRHSFWLSGRGCYYGNVIRGILWENCSEGSTIPGAF